MAGHILLAEDDKALSALMQDFFRAAGVAVTPAYDGEQALVLAQEQPFDLLVLDVMMPHLNGLEVCEAVRQGSDVPVIFVTALMQDFFRAAGVAVTPAYDGEQALVLAQEQPFDLLVLDVMMPHLNGLEVCEAVRQGSDVPVIFVTALGQEGDTLAGFRAGADDYITKPFSFPVLVAKAQALMRRARGLRLGASELGYANILMDTASGTVTVDGNPVNLRPKEAKILELLLREQGRTVSRDLLIERVWGTDFDGDERMIDRHIASLRKALGTASQHIRAVYGKGYRLGGST